MAAKRRSKRSESGSERDKSGRFKPGNKAGVGHGRPRNAARETIQKALGGEQGLTELVETLKMQADSGDVQAARMLIEMGWGKAREQSQTVELPSREVNSAEDVQRTIREILQAMATGSIDPETAQVMVRAATMGSAPEVDSGDEDIPDAVFD
ncbi:MAG: hypothetical protein ACPGVY_15100 [Mycobacterium sp.]